MKEHFGCPVQATANAIAGKWKVLILWHLSFAPLRFAELRDLLTGVSEKVLSAQLRDLGRAGIVQRFSEHTIPPRVTYKLSPAGIELVPVMQAMCDWGIRHLRVPSNMPRNFEFAND
jgi:DNA-binding HxlR family transcriptional regulator